jgi:ribosomal protein L32
LLSKWWLWLKKRLGWTTDSRPLHLTCANCGERLTSRHFCRACGASEESGWAAPEMSEDGEDDFDYDDFVRREFGRRQGRPRNVAATVWGTILILLLVIGMLLAQFAGGF